MPRKARKTSKTGIYHIMIRGINKESLFLDVRDGLKFLECLKECKEKYDFELFAYCFMGNHAHLLIKENDKSISVIMKEICGKYGSWFNAVHDRVGHVFQDRFRSECVETEVYLHTVFRYILKNPVKAKIVSKAEDYRWSSCREYIYGKKGITDTQNLWDLMGKTMERDRAHLLKQLQKEDSLQDLVYLTADNASKSDEEAEAILQQLMKKWGIRDVAALNRFERELFLGHLKANGLKKRQYEHLTKGNQEK